jgi:hypothetical protein
MSLIDSDGFKGQSTKTVERDIERKCLSASQILAPSKEEKSCEEAPE